MFRTLKSRLALFAATAALLLTPGCVVGPNFKKPAPPDVGGYTPTPISTTSSTPKVAGGEAQRLVNGQDIPGEWWILFHSKPLNDLIERALKANPDLKAAQAALAVAIENVLAQRGLLSQCYREFYCDPGEVSRRSFTCYQHHGRELQPLHAASERLVCARRFWS